MISLNLKQVMDEKGISIQELSDETKLSRNTISQMYNGNSKGIQFESLNRLIKVLKVNIFDLIIEEYDTKNLTPKVDLTFTQYGSSSMVYLVDEKSNITFTFEADMDFDSDRNIYEISVPYDDSIEFSNILFFFYDIPEYLKEYTFYQISHDIFNQLANYKEKIFEYYEYDITQLLNSNSYVIFKMESLTEKNSYMWDKNLMLDKLKTIDLLIEKYSLQQAYEPLK